jgi:hypothetical protein
LNSVQHGLRVTGNGAMVVTGGARSVLLASGSAAAPAPRNCTAASMLENERWGLPTPLPLSSCPAACTVNGSSVCEEAMLLAPPDDELDSTWTSAAWADWSAWNSGCTPSMSACVVLHDAARSDSCGESYGVTSRTVTVVAGDSLHMTSIRMEGAAGLLVEDGAFMWVGEDPTDAKAASLLENDGWNGVPGNCSTHPLVFGCTLSFSPNYDPMATANDGTCTFPADALQKTELGCTHQYVSWVVVRVIGGGMEEGGL